MNQRQLLVALTRAVLVVSFGLGGLDLLAVQLSPHGDGWLKTPIVPALGFTLGSNLEWAQRGLWAALAWLLLGPLAGLGLLSRPDPQQPPSWDRTLQSLMRPLLLGSAALIVSSVIVRTYSAGPSKLDWLLVALRAGVTTVASLVVAIRLQGPGLEPRSERAAVPGPPVPVPSQDAADATFVRWWWHWRARPRGLDWVFAGFVVLALSLFGWRLSSQRLEDNAFHSLDECLAHADVTCANVALERLAKVGVTGPRLKVGVLGTQLLAEGWTAPTAESLRALQAELGPQGLAGAEALLAVGDAAAAHGEGAVARGHWANARGKGADALIEARLLRLQEQEAARLTAERDAQVALQLEAATRRSVEEARRVDDARQRAATKRVLLDGALGRIQLDFEAALDDARELRTESLQIRLRMLGESISGVPQVAQLRFRAALQALYDVARVVDRFTRPQASLKGSQPPSYQRQLEAQGATDVAKVEQLLSLAQEQFDLGLTVMRGLPVQVVAPPVLEIIPLEGR